MSAPAWKRLSRFSDGLVDPEFRVVGTYKGVEWVTDRYVMVRTDVFTRPVTARLPKGVTAFGPLRDSSYRKVLGGIPRDLTGARLGATIQTDEFKRLIVSDGRVGVLVDAGVAPLLEACEGRSIHNGRVVGFQQRPRSARPVLVCVVQPVRWHALESRHYEAVTS